MRGTQAQHADVKARFQLRRRRQLGLAWVVVALVLFRLLLVGRPGTPFAGIERGLLIAGTVAAVVSILAFSLWNWRCPACRSYLGRSLSLRRCPSCGVELC